VLELGSVIVHLVRNPTHFRGPFRVGLVRRQLPQALGTDANVACRDELFFHWWLPESQKICFAAKRRDRGPARQVAACDERRFAIVSAAGLACW
jgi:hypothetical protein